MKNLQENLEASRRLSDKLNDVIARTHRVVEIHQLINTILFVLGSVTAIVLWLSGGTTSIIAIAGIFSTAMFANLYIGSRRISAA